MMSGRAGSPRVVWDAIAKEYDVIWEVADYSTVLESIVHETGMQLGMRILDIAMGTARVSIAAAARVGEYGKVLGVESSEQMLKEAMSKKNQLGYSNIDFILADAHNLPFLSGSFDVVTSCFALAFMVDPQEVAREIARVVKQEGKMASVEYQKPPLDFWAVQRIKANIHDFAEQELAEMLRSAGFGKIRIKLIQVLHRKPNVSEDAANKFQLVSGRIMGLEENDSIQFWQRVGKESAKLPKEKRSWLPIICVGVKDPIRNSEV